MYPLVETIKIINGKPQNLEWHQKRYNYSHMTIFGRPPEMVLEDVIKVPVNFRSGVVKCRFLYNTDSFTAEFQNYIKREINSLKIVVDNNIEYGHKFTDRSSINNLLDRKGDCEDILIIKDGKVTDTSFSNIVFYDGRGWYTPSSPLLKGTARERLLKTGKILSRDITRDDLKLFSGCRLINSMLDFEDQRMFVISGIK